MQICKLVNDIIASNDNILLHKAGMKPFQAWISLCCGIWTSPHPSGAELFACAGDMHVAETGLHLPLPSLRAAAFQGILLIAMQGIL